MNKIDIYFDFRKESKARDPDRWSPTLQEYHRIVWSKPLPNGKIFTLNKISQNRLYHKSELSEFYLSSDMLFMVLYENVIEQNLLFLKYQKQTLKNLNS